MGLLDAMVAGASLWEPKAARLWPQRGVSERTLGATVLHGDAHQWNHLFRKAEAASTPADPNDLMLIDWQFTGRSSVLCLFYLSFLMQHCVFVAQVVATAHGRCIIC